MKHCRLSILLLLVAFVLSTNSLSAQECEHFVWTITYGDMSVILQVVTLDGDLMLEGDEVGVFTPNMLCAGGMAIVNPEDTIGVAAWPDDVDSDSLDGFEDGEELFFRVWERETDHEWAAEIYNIRMGEPEFHSNTWLMCSIRAERITPPAIELSTNAIDFPNFTGEAIPMELEIISAGLSDLVVSDIVVEGDAFSTDFEGEPITLEPDATHTLTVTFDPGEEEGEHNGTLTIDSNDPAHPDTVVTLYGTFFIDPRIALSDTSHDFGVVSVDSTRVWNNFFIYNQGGETLVVDDIATNSEFFETTFEENIEIEPDGRALVVVSFTPAEAAEYETVMTIHSNDPDNEEVTVRLTGTGRSEVDPVITLAEGQHFFSRVNLDETVYWRMTILNQGGSDLWIYDVISDSAGYDTDWNADSVRLRPDDHFYVMVSFNPEEELIYGGLLRITSNDPEVNGREEEEERFTFCYLGGEGTADELPHFVHFRIGEGHLLLIEETTFEDEVLVEGDEVGVFTPGGLCAGGGIIEENGRVGFTAWVDGYAEDNIIDGFLNGQPFRFMVWDADAEVEGYGRPDFIEGPETFVNFGHSWLTLAAEPIGPEPIIRVSSREYHFGQVDYDDEQTADWLFTIGNHGFADLEITSIEVDLEEVFSLEFAGGDVIVIEPDGEPLEVIVTFAPNDTGRFFGRITIESNDPFEPELYVDVDGVGVVEVLQPRIELSAYSHFFGVQHTDPEEPYEFDLEIANTGGADLRVTDIIHQGSEAISSGFDREIMVPAGEARTLTMTFDPPEAEQYDALLTFVTNDPIEPRDRFTFLVRGYGSDAEDRFLHLITPAEHAIHVDSAYGRYEDQRMHLGPGDEVAVFTSLGLCVGHVVLVEDEDINLTAYGDDRESEFITDGFESGDEMTFKFWDWTLGQEFVCDEVVYVSGNEVFAVNGTSAVYISAPVDVIERQVASEPRSFDFGPVTVDESVEITLTIYNSGGQTLTITNITTTVDELETDFDGEERELQPGLDEGFDLIVTFTPSQDVAYDGAVVIHSGDPDQPEFNVHVTGMGSLTERHWPFMGVSESHSILIMEFTMGNDEEAVMAAIGDEVGVFAARTDEWGEQVEFCAGASIVEDPNALLGVGAWGDIFETRYLKEGFAVREEMHFRVWDRSQQLEYVQDLENQGIDNPVVIDVIQGSLEWSVNGYTRINLNVPDVFILVPIPNQEVLEGDQVAFGLEVRNPPNENMVFAFEGSDPEIPEEDWNLDNADFTWDVSFDAAEPPRQLYVLTFSASDPENVNIRDEGTVLVTVLNFNRIPYPDQEWLTDEQNEFIWDAENEIWVYIGYEEDDPWETVIPDLTAFFIDEDLDALEFYWDFGEPNVVDIRIEDNAYQVKIDGDNEHFSGDVALLIEAEDGQEGPPEEEDDHGRNVRTLRLTTRIVPIETFMRTLRGVNGIPALDPRRDEMGQFPFVFRIAPVNDAPEIWDTDNDEPYPDDEEITVRGGEGEELIFILTAQDVDHDVDQLVWTMSDRNDLPEEGPVFTDNGDGTGTFTWTPTYDDSREPPYTPTFQVEDSGGDEGETDAIVVNILISNVNRDPRFTEEYAEGMPDRELAEDGGLTVLYDLDDVFLDPDGDVMIFIVDAPDELQVAINENNELTVTTIDNYWIGDPGAAIYVTADDNNGGILVDTLQVIVTPVNDPPGQFLMETPLDRYIVPPDSDFVTFSWTESEPVFMEGDDVITYIFIVKNARAPADSAVIPDLELTSYRVNVDEALSWLGLTRYRAEERQRLIWYVLAEDQGGLITIAINAAFLLDVEMSVEDEYGSAIPDDYFLAPSFPNPFNARTTIRYGLPAPGNVEVNVWDMHGRKVADLESKYHNAGRYELIWDADGVTSGVYIIKIVSGNFRAMQKVILIR